jgi:chromosome partitioning protein
MEIPEPAAPLDDTQPRETRQTQVVAVGALKGGTGKSRLAMLMALILKTVFGYRVVVFDADSGSQTSSNWPLKAKQRAYDWGVEVIRHPFDTLHDEIDKVIDRGDVDYIIVDVGGGNVGAFQSAVQRAHKLLVPLCPDEGDLEQAPKTRDAAFMAATLNPWGCAFYYVLSRCENSRDREDSRDVLLSEDTRYKPDDPRRGPYPLLDTDIPMLVAYKRTFGRIPRMKGSPAIDPDCPRWDELVGFVPMLLEMEILTVEQVLDAKLMTKREVGELVPMLLNGEVLSREEILELDLMEPAKLDDLVKELAV